MWIGRGNVALVISIALISGLTLGAAATAPTTQPNKSKSAAIAIKGMQFVPPVLTIKAGQTVTWTNADDREHTVDSADGSFKSDNLKAGNTFSYKFAKKGKYAYSCSYHPRMKGTIIVTD